MVIPQEEVLLTQLRSGHAHAVTAWYTYTHKALHLYVQKRVASSEDADEIVHDIYLSCLASLPLFRGSSGLWTWMMSITRHELADYWRKRYAKKALAIFPFGEELLHLFASQDIPEGNDVEEVLRRLPKSTAELLSLKYIDNFSLKELAIKMGIGVAAVQSKLYRAKLAFAKEYKKAIEEGS